MKKKLLSIMSIGISICMGITAFAAVYGVHEEKTNWKLDYPVVTVENNVNVQNLINADLGQYITALKADFAQGRFYDGGGYYTVHYEDNDVLSISLYLTRHPFGGNGNHTAAISIVYDKHTGQRIPLYNYVHVTPKDLDYYKDGSTYTQSGKRLDYKYLWRGPIKRVPENYFLPGDGSVCLVFKPYELSAGAMGATYIKLDPKYIEYLNRKNQW